MLPNARRKGCTLPRSNAFVACACFALTAALAGCAQSPAQVATTERRERIESWQKLCDDRGFVRGTSDWAVCVEGYDKAAYDAPPLPPSALR